MIDTSKMRSGDEVAIRGFVESVERNGDFVTVKWSPLGRADRFSPSAIVSHTPKPPTVGDKVRTRAGSTGAVLAIDGEVAWVRLDDRYSTTRTTLELASLEVAE